MNCPKCDSTQTGVRESRTLTNGTRRRRHQCQACGHRWTAWDGRKPTKREANLARRSPPAKKIRPPLTDEQVLCVLSSPDLSSRDLAELIGTPIGTVQRIRSGQSYGHVRPDMIRPNSTRRGARPPLTDEQVRSVLVHPDLCNRDLAELIGASPETVRRVRAGQRHGNLHPELIRPNDTRPRAAATGPSCERCSSWTGTGCDFGFPDALLEGPGFAADCDLYTDANQSSSLA